MAREVGGALTRDPRLAGVVFTGSTDTARLIERSMAARPGAIGTLIAETGGLNVMLADSSALAEQLVLDVVQSGFNSAGQRCSALRVLLVQEEIAPRVKTLLAGCMDDLVLGDPARLETDVGPVIDDDALAMLDETRRTDRRRRGLESSRAAGREPEGRFFAPLAVEIDSLASMQREVFGPVVHLLTYRARDLDAVVAAVNALGYGLTLGIHTRIDGLAQRIARALRVGNVYINRNMIGAVVGVQPFRRHGALRHGPQGRRAALPASHGDRADHHHQHGGHRRQCRAAVARGALARLYASVVASKTEHCVARRGAVRLPVLKVHPGCADTERCAIRRRGGTGNDRSTHAPVVRCDSDHRALLHNVRHPAAVRGRRSCSARFAPWSCSPRRAPTWRASPPCSDRSIAR